ncbi:heme exporter protein CcmB [Flammeovirgaceae bacterium SG7u.111]|nr:heme exporter protein CcmB [Flammeovirgaceae bacterium SG7u.132]WPO36122.1 heme exporter protein CcmB [Flammeovirgaceae bacterium SG7u.111]
MQLFFKEVWVLVQKEFKLEWRQKYAFNGILLYVVGVVFVCYLSFNLRMGELTPITWNTLFWIIILFSAINGVSKSFQQEREGRYIFYYQIVGPEAIICSKIIYNTILMLAVSFAGLLVFSVVMGNPVQDLGLYILVLFLGAIGFSSGLTLVSGIAAKASNSGTAMSILGLPVILPMLLMLIKVSKNAMDGLDRTVSYDEILTIFAINLIVIVVSIILFPYLWRT